jgi:hypothetical protein
MINNEGRLAYNNEGGRRVTKFFSFGIDHRTDSFGIWNVLTNNTVAYVNPSKKVVYVRQNSMYADALSKMKGWTVVKSDTLRRHSRRGSQARWYVKYFSTYQWQAINALTEETSFIVDLGPERSRRHSVLVGIYSNLTRSSDRRKFEVAASGDYPRRRITLTLGPEAPAVAVTEETVAEVTAEVQSIQGIDIPHLSNATVSYERFTAPPITPGSFYVDHVEANRVNDDVWGRPDLF